MKNRTRQNFKSEKGMTLVEVVISIGVLGIIAATLPGNYTFVAGDNGQHTNFSATFQNTGNNQSITATDTVTGSITGTQTGIHIN